MKILNLYASVGGNRLLWNSNHFGLEVTAVENDPTVAEIYQNDFPNDVVIIDDAHQFLLKNYTDYNIIWTSPPCQTHSAIRYNLGVKSKKANFPAQYIDLTLYQEIIFLQKHFKGLYIVENVKPYYEPLIEPNQKIGTHFFWTNFYLPSIKIKSQLHEHGKIKELEERKNISLQDYKFEYRKKRQILRNAVPAELGLHVLNAALDFQLDSEQKYFNFSLDQENK